MKPKNKLIKYIWASLILSLVFFIPNTLFVFHNIYTVTETVWLSWGVLLIAFSAFFMPLFFILKYKRNINTKRMHFNKIISFVIIIILAQIIMTDFFSYLLNFLLGRYNYFKNDGVYLFEISISILLSVNITKYFLKLFANYINNIVTSVKSIRRQVVREKTARR